MREEERITATATEGNGGDGVYARLLRALSRYGKLFLVLVPFLYVIEFLPRIGVMDRGDAAQAYYQAGDAIRDGRSMYEPLPPTGPHRIGNYYLYPPPLGALVAILPRMRPDTFQALVMAANIAALWIFSWAVARLAGMRPIWGTPLVALGLTLIPGVTETVHIGNIDPIVFALVGLGLVLPPAAAAIALAGGAALKVTPVWALGVLVARMGRATWKVTALAAAACLAIVVLAVGFGGLVDESLLWARRIAPTLSQGQFEVFPITVRGEPRSGWMVNGNISPAFVPIRMLVEQPPPNQDIPIAARLFLTLVQFGVPALTVWLTRKRPVREQAAWVIAAATLAAPIMRGGYLPVLLVVPAILLGKRRRAAAAEPAAAAPSPA